MADNPLGTHVQGCEEEGGPVEKQRPVLVGVEDSNGNLEVPNLGPNGGLLVEPAPGAAAATVNQGAPNAGGIANAWAVHQPDRGASGSLVNAGDTVVLALDGMSTVSFTVEGVYTGAIAVEVSGDGGTSYAPVIYFTNLANGALANSPLGSGSIGSWTFSATALTHCRLRATGAHTGTASVFLNASIAADPVTQVLNAISGIVMADGSTNSITLIAAANSNTLTNKAYTFVKNGTTNLWDMLRTPATFKTAVATASGNTAVWTPAAGKKFRLMRLQIGLTGDVKQAVSGVITVKFQDASSDIGISYSVFVPSTALSTNGNEFNTGWVDLGNGFLSAAANNVLNINLSAALTGGTVYVNAIGSEE